MRRHYLTKNEYETAEYRIYNDLPAIVDEDISEVREKFNEEVVKELLLPGEEYLQTEARPHYVITSYGRIINSDTRKSIKPTITGGSIQYALNDQHINCKRDFDKFGWKYDHSKLVKLFFDNKWKYRLSYKGKIEDLFI